MRGERSQVWFCVGPVSGVESSGFVLCSLVAQWWGRSVHYWGFLLFSMDFMRSMVWFKIFNQPQKRFSPLILFISWIRLFLTVAYFVGFYVWQILPEEPERNFFAFNFIRLHITAFWELVQCAFFSLTIRHGPQYQESAVSLLARVVGLTVPGVIPHNPINYVNAVQLGPCSLAERIEKDIFQTLRSVFFALPALPGNALWDYLYDKLSTGAQSPRQWTWNKSLKTQI